MEYIRNYISAAMTLAIAGIVCIALQKKFPSIINQKWLANDSKLNFYYWLLNTFVIAYIISFFVALALTLTALINPQLLSKINNVSTEKINALQVMVSVVALDFTGYWLHRLFHSNKLWKFHSIHHSPNEIDWLTSARFHPIESVIVVATMYVLVVLIGFGIKTVTLALAIRAAYGYLVHANLSWHYGPFGYIFASPYFHRWHHTKKKEGINKNFAGVFSLWDFSFKTAYHPKSLQPHNFGVHQHPGETLWQQLSHPFRK